MHTPTVMKCFERLVLAHLNNCLPPTLDPLHFTYCQNRRIEDAIPTPPSPTWTTVTPAWEHYSLPSSPVHASNPIFEFANADWPHQQQHWVGLHLALRCTNNILALNTEKNKELVVNFRKIKGGAPFICINGSEVKHVTNFRCLSVHISKDFSWTRNNFNPGQEGSPAFHNSEEIERSPSVSADSHEFVTSWERESILTSCTSIRWGTCSVLDLKALQRVVKAKRLCRASSVLPLGGTTGPFVPGPVGSGTASSPQLSPWQPPTPKVIILNHFLQDCPYCEYLTCVNIYTAVMTPTIIPAAVYSVINVLLLITYFTYMTPALFCTYTSTAYCNCCTCSYCLFITDLLYCVKLSILCIHYLCIHIYPLLLIDIYSASTHVVIMLHFTALWTSG